MPAGPSEDFPAALAILLVGMLVPALVAAVARDFLSMYVTARQFVVVFAVAFGIVSWGLIERLDLDRTTVLLVSIVWPWLVFLAGLFVVLLLDRGAPIATGPVTDVFRYFTGAFDGPFGYAVAFVIAGVAAVAVSKQFDVLAAHDDRVPEARVVFVAIGLAVVLGGFVVAGANHVNASPASVSTVEPGVQPHQVPSLNVTVEGRPAELRVTAVAPDATSVTKRLSRAELRGGTATVGFRVRWTPRSSLPIRPGTYRVRLTTLAGVTVDTAEYHLERAPTASIGSVVVGSGPSDRAELPERTVVLAPTHDTAVGVVVENPSVFASYVSVGVRAPGTYADSFEIHVGPGERAGVVLSIPDDAVAAIHDEHDGVVTVELTQEGRTVATTEVDLDLPTA